MNKKDLMGQVFDRLTVIAEAPRIVGKTGLSSAAWICECACKDKTQKVIKAGHLLDGSTKSCGCLNDEKRAERVDKLWGARVKYTPQEASARRVFSKQYSDSDLTFEAFMILSQQNCYYCNAAPSNTSNTYKECSASSQKSLAEGNFIYSGLDRLDNTKPHSKENCVPCCKHCNYAKRDRTSEDFDNWIISLYNNRILPKQI